LDLTTTLLIWLFVIEHPVMLAGILLMLKKLRTK